MHKVIYIEDDENNRMLVRRLVMAEGLEFEEADNAQTGLNLIFNDPPDLILMDVSMPVMNGLVATKHIRQNPKVADIPIIALTANAMEGDRERFLEAGCDGYISKPIEVDTFIEQIMQFLR